MSAGPLSSSLEDYLEAIHHIVHQKGAARGKDIAERLGVNRSSVTGALRSLAEKGLINYAPYDIVTLTPDGEQVAGKINHRHEVLKSFFTRILGVDERSADENACRIEHTVSENILDRLARFIDFIQVCPRVDLHWIEGSGYFCRQPEPGEPCERCIEECMKAWKERHRADAENPQ